MYSDLLSLIFRPLPTLNIKQLGVAQVVIHALERSILWSHHFIGDSLAVGEVQRAYVRAHPGKEVLYHSTQDTHLSLHCPLLLLLWVTGPGQGRKIDYINLTEK